MRGRRIVALVGCLAVAAVVAWMQAGVRLPLKGPELPQAGKFYAVELSAAGGSIDLEFDGQSRYELILGSLGDAIRTYTVRMDAQARASVERFSAVPRTGPG